MLRKIATSLLVTVISAVFTTHASAADYEISGKLNSNKCLHKKFGGWKNGNPIHVWDCDAGNPENKTWNFWVK